MLAILAIYYIDAALQGAGLRRHIYNIAMAAILAMLYRANVGALSIEFANPRHQHE